MLNLNNIIKYQQLAAQLNKLEREAGGGEERIIMNKMQNYVKDAQNKTVAYDNKANDFINEYNTLKKDYDKSLKTIKQLTAKNAEKLSPEEMAETFDEINALGSELYMLERKLNIVITNMKNILKDFEITRNNAKKARAKYQESKEKSEKNSQGILPEINKIKAEMKKLESSIDEKVLAKYKSMKNDGIFPVFVKLLGKQCGGCHMEIPSGKLDKLKADNHLSCDNCGRIIYTEQ